MLGALRLRLGYQIGFPSLSLHALKSPQAMAVAHMVDDAIRNFVHAAWPRSVQIFQHVDTAGRGHGGESGAGPSDCCKC